MSREFLASILKMENSVGSDSRQPCCICLQDFGSLSSETGVIECGIRLSCSHHVGSSCIATWLRSNNTCPVCRHVFFPAQPRPYLEHGIIEDETPRSPEREYRLCCRTLGLSNRATDIAWKFYQNLLRRAAPFGGHHGNCVGAAAMYIVSHIMGEPKSLEVISALVRVPVDHVRCLYQSIHRRRDEIVFREFFLEPATLANAQGFYRMLCARATMTDMLALLPAPTDDDGMIKGYTEVAALKDGEYDLISRREEIDQRIGPLCTQLGYDQGLVGGLINTFSLAIAHKIRRTMFQDCRSPQLAIAVSLYMASHLLCIGTSIKRISEVVGLSEHTIRTTYRSVYPRRAALVEPQLFRNVPRVRVLQALSWPPLT